MVRCPDVFKNHRTRRVFEALWNHAEGMRFSAIADAVDEGDDPEPVRHELTYMMGVGLVTMVSGTSKDQVWRIKLEDEMVRVLARDCWRLTKETESSHERGHTVSR